MFYILLLVILLVYLLWPYISRWAFNKAMRTMQEKMNEKARHYTDAGRRGDYDTTQSEDEKSAEKVDFDDIAKRKFEKKNSDDYVEFEEVNK